MKSVPNPPQLQILVCTNRRGEQDPLPCCAASEAEAIYEMLHSHVLERGWAQFVYVTRTYCMAACHAEGVTVVLQPLNVWLHRVNLADARRILTEFVEPLIETSS